MSLIFRYTHDPHALLVLSLLNLVSVKPEEKKTKRVCSNEQVTVWEAGTLHSWNLLRNHVHGGSESSIFHCRVHHWLRCVPGQWQVTVPEERIHILVGETATFSCFLSPETNAEGMEVRFFKNQFDDVVHLYRDKKDQENMRMPEYRRRTELVKDSLDRGHATLKLQKVTLSDAGLYGCWFRSQTHVQEATWELQVTELGSPPLISIMGHVDGGIQLLCHTSGWFPQPTIKWKTPQGTYLSSDSKVKKNMHGLFDVETSLTVQDNSGNVSCSVQPPDQSQEVESRVWVRERFFQSSPWSVAFILLMIFFFVLCAAIILLRRFSPKFQGKIQKELVNVQGSLEWRKARKHAVKVTLDPDSAHPQLYISPLNSISNWNARQLVEFSEKRFTSKSVVAFPGFQNGKQYWEVDVGFNKSWVLGVCQNDVDRTEENVSLFPKNGYWVLGLESSVYFINDDCTIIPLVKTPPTRVGVFLDYEGESISFFNVNSRSLIYTLTYQFEGLLLPYFQCKMKTVTPISISPVPLI